MALTYYLLIIIAMPKTLSKVVILHMCGASRQLSIRQPSLKQMVCADATPWMSDFRFVWA